MLLVKQIEFFFHSLTFLCAFSMIFCWFKKPYFTTNTVCKNNSLLIFSEFLTKCVIWFPIFRLCLTEFLCFPQIFWKHFYHLSSDSAEMILDCCPCSVFLCSPDSRWFPCSAVRKPFFLQIPHFVFSFQKIANIFTDLLCCGDNLYVKYFRKTWSS